MTTHEGVSGVAAEVGTIDMLEVLGNPLLLERTALLHAHVAGELHRLYYWNPRPTEAHRSINARLQHPEQYDDNARTQTAFRRLSDRYLVHEAYEQLNNGSVRARLGGNTRTAVREFVQHELVIAGMVHGLFSGTQTIESFGQWLQSQQINRRDALEVIASAHEKIDYAVANKKAGMLRWQLRRLWLQTMVHAPGLAPELEADDAAVPAQSGPAELMRNRRPTTLGERLRLATIALGYGHSPLEKKVQKSRKETLGHARMAAALFKVAHAQLGMNPGDVRKLAKETVFGEVAQRMEGQA